MSCTVQCSRSASIDSSAFMLVVRASGTLPNRLQSIYKVFDASDSPDSASTRLDDFVSPPAGADFSRSRFQSSTTARWVRMVGGSSGINGGWCGWPRCVTCRALPLSVLIRFVFSQRSRFEPFRLAACAARCAVHSTSYPIHLVAFAISLALPIALDVSRLDFLARMTSWPSISTRQVRIADTLVPLAPGAYPIEFGAVYNLMPARTALDDPRLDLLPPTVFWLGISIRRAHFAPVFARATCGAFLVDV